MSIETSGHDRGHVATVATYEEMASRYVAIGHGHGGHVASDPLATVATRLAKPAGWPLAMFVATRLWPVAMLATGLAIMGVAK